LKNNCAYTHVIIIIFFNELNNVTLYIL